MSIGIYKIINKINGKFYIGSSINIEKRIISHFSELRNNKHHSRKLQKSYNKYGKEAFKWEIIELCQTEDLIKREQHYLNNHFDDNCMNIFKQAYSVCGENHPMFGRKHTPQARAKIKEARKRQVIKHSDETKRKIGKGNKGRAFDPEHIKKMIKSREGLSPWNKGLKIPNKLKIILPKDKIQELKDFYSLCKSINKTSKHFNLNWQVTKRHLQEF